MTGQDEHDPWRTLPGSVTWDSIVDDEPTARASETAKRRRCPDVPEPAAPPTERCGRCEVRIFYAYDQDGARRKLLATTDPSGEFVLEPPELQYYVSRFRPVETRWTWNVSPAQDGCQRPRYKVHKHNGVPKERR